MSKITVQATVDAAPEKVWKLWSNPDDVKQWNSASPDWHTPKAENDLREGGNFTYRMEAKDGSMGFDFGGTYDKVVEHKQIDYTIGDGRQVTNTFAANGNATDVVVTFDAETQNPEDMQRMGWQSILDSFKAYAESK